MAKTSARKLPLYLQEAKFVQDYRCFKAGDTFHFEPGLTLLVGDQGCGKSSLLNLIGDRRYNVDKDVIEMVLTGKVTSLYFDTERGNPRTSNMVQGIWDVASRFQSHGQTQLAMYRQAVREFSNTLILLDEPDTALSIRSCIKLVELLDELVRKNNNQLIVSVHNPIVIESAHLVLSLEHKKWMTGCAFIAEQKTERYG